MSEGEVKAEGWLEGEQCLSSAGEQSREQRWLRACRAHFPEGWLLCGGKQAGLEFRGDLYKSQAGFVP